MTTVVQRVLKRGEDPKARPKRDEFTIEYRIITDDDSVDWQDVIHAPDLPRVWEKYDDPRVDAIAKTVKVERDIDCPRLFRAFVFYAKQTEAERVVIHHFPSSSPQVR